MYIDITKKEIAEIFYKCTNFSNPKWKSEIIYRGRKISGPPRWRSRRVWIKTSPLASVATYL